MKLLVAVAVLGLVSFDADCQMTRQRDRSGSPREMTREREPVRPNAAAGDPIAALERELPSLKVDLILTAQQVAPWSVFERDVREVAELDRSRTKRLMAMRNTASKPDALSFVASLVEDDRQKADATADLQKHLKDLYGALDDAQRRMLDRRMVLAQTEPITVVSPPPR